MNNWFECTVKFDKTGEDGLIRTVTEKYLVDALSFTDAEARINAEMKPFISGELLVASVSRKKIAELFESDDASADKWFRCKVNMLALDEDKGIEKRVPFFMYVQASNIEDALSSLLEGLKKSLGDFEVAGITETAIMDVYHYKPLEELKQ